MNVYFYLFSNETNTFHAFVKKSDKEKVNEDIIIKISFDSRYEAILTINDVIKETSKITEKDLKFEDNLTVNKDFTLENKKFDWREA